MSREFHKPVRRPSDVIDELGGSGDPADLSAVAHDTAAALLHRVRAADDPASVEQLLAYTDANGVSELAELWSSAGATSLPGTLWRLYRVRQVVVDAPEPASYLFRRGLDIDQGVNQAIAGAPTAPSPEELVSLATEILRGAFTGDFAVALERAAAFSRVLALGCDDVAHGEAASERGHRYRALADEFTAAAALWRQDRLH